MKMEAVAVLTQATDPWIDLESTLMTLGVHLEKFIVALTSMHPLYNILIYLFFTSNRLHFITSFALQLFL